jgi:hypothetical protein
MLPAWLARLACVTLIVIATTAAAAAAETLSPASATAWRIGFGFRFVNLQRATSQVCAIQGGDRLVGFSGISHFDKSKAAGAAGFTVRNNADTLDCAVRLKQATKLGLGSAVRQVADV